MKKLSIIFFSLLFFFSYKNVANAEVTEWLVPTRFAGMHYGDAVYWENVTNLADFSDTEFARFNAPFGNPCPVTWYKSFGFSLDALNTTQITKIEVEAKMRKSTSSVNYNVYAYIVNPDGDVATALNAVDSVGTGSISSTSFAWKNFYWSDSAGYPNVSQYFGYPTSLSDLVLLIGIQTSQCSGTSGLIDTSQLHMRITYGGTTFMDNTINPSNTQLAIDNLKDLLDTKAPFGYLTPLSDIHFTATSGADFAFNYPLKLGDQITYIPAVIPNVQGTGLSIIRNITGLAMIGSLVIYLIGLASRIL